jgi:hypothetical protein
MTAIRQLVLEKEITAALNDDLFVKFLAWELGHNVTAEDVKCALVPPDDE